MKGQLRIETVYAFIVVDDDGTEGIPAIQSPEGGWVPLVGADLERVSSLRELVPFVARGKRVTLAHFTRRQDIEVFEP